MTPDERGPPTGIVRLFTSMARSHLIPSEPVPFILPKAIEGQVTGCNNWVYGIIGSPGVITQCPDEGYSVYGLHSNSFTAFDLIDNGWFYGSYRSPEVLFKGLQRLGLLSAGSRDESVINGCMISIGAVHGKDRTHDWSIGISPDHDLREQYPAQFDPAEVEGLEKTVRGYITQEGLQDKVTVSIDHETLLMAGSPFHHGFWNSDNPHPRFGNWVFDF